MVSGVPGHSEATAHLSFGQREGTNPIPKPLQLGDLSRELRALLWAATYQSLTKPKNTPHGPRNYPFYGKPWGSILKKWHVRVQHNPIDEFSPQCRHHDDSLKKLFFSGTYVELFDFLEFIMRSRSCPEGFVGDVAKVLKIAHAAYIVVDKQAIFPASTVEEATILERAFANLQNNSCAGARSHLLKAGEELNKGKYADSIRESIHAVESIARTIVPEAKTLAPALAALEKGGELHSALKKGFGALYGFTSDEQGIRHPLLDKIEAEVDRESAVFMLGACASFLSFLANKGRQAGLIK